MTPIRRLQLWSYNLASYNWINLYILSRANIANRSQGATGTEHSYELLRLNIQGCCANLWNLLIFFKCNLWHNLQFIEGGQYLVEQQVLFDSKMENVWTFERKQFLRIIREHKSIHVTPPLSIEVPVPSLVC